MTSEVRAQIQHVSTVKGLRKQRGFLLWESVLPTTATSKTSFFLSTSSTPGPPQGILSCVLFVNPLKNTGEGRTVIAPFSNTEIKEQKDKVTYLGPHIQNHWVLSLGSSAQLQC